MACAKGGPLTSWPRACLQVRKQPSRPSSGTGTTRSAGHTNSSRHVPRTSTGTTRVPGSGLDVPGPSASTTPTHSMPGLTGRAGCRAEPPTDNMKIAQMHGRQTHAHQQFFRPRHWNRNVPNCDHVRRLAVAFECECFHDVLSSFQ
jgi:hypothetical protein